MHLDNFSNFSINRAIVDIFLLFLLPVHACKAYYAVLIERKMLQIILKKSHNKAYKCVIIDVINVQKILSCCANSKNAFSITLSRKFREEVNKISRNAA